ncbi:MAG: AAA family ATPase [Myxococcales bacterium]|jgi:predicted ATPase|nr:AAA family ATPase [Myxococcales bacterium]
MLTELEITGFRCFPKLSAKPLGRVNLIVGKNNSGKTAFLDAVELLAWDSDSPPIFRSLVRREEYSRKVVEQGRGVLFNRYDLDVPNLFYGHSVTLDSSFAIRSNSRSVGVRCAREDGILTVPTLLIEAAGRLSQFDLNSGYLRRVETTGRLEDLFTRSRTEVLFLPTWRSDLTFLSKLWDEVLLTDDEPLVVEALRLIEPRVEKVAVRGDAEDRHFAIRLKGDKQPQRLGTLGDGMRHILAIALHLVPAQKGYLLIDEIDSGLHFSVMAKMWRMVLETARRLDIQVFATTHSMDCIHALAEVHQQQRLTPDDLMLHRLEPELGKTISYTPDDLAAVAEFQGEVR